MNGRTARKLRKAIGFVPRANRKYEVIETPKVVNFPGGKVQVIIRETNYNDPQSPRGMYKIVKDLFYNGVAKNVDTNPEVEYTNLEIN